MPTGGYRPGSGRPKWSGTYGAGTFTKEPSEGPVEPQAGVLEDRLPVPDAPKAPRAADVETPLEYFKRIMNDPEIDPARRDRAAGMLLPYCHPRAGEDGKKGQREEAAAAAGKGKFATAPPPKLAVNNK